jgi:hypothetical protein
MTSPPLLVNDFRAGIVQTGGGEAVPYVWMLRTHCGNGHPWNEANTLILSTTGQRQCRACRNEAAKRRRRQKKQDGFHQE